MIITKSYPIVVYSWIIQSEYLFIKNMDRSVFLHYGTGIPREIRSFFEVSDIEPNEKRDITIKHRGVEYRAYIECDKINRTRLFWYSDFSFIINEKLRNWGQYYKKAKENPDIYPEMQFIKEKEDLYNIEFFDHAFSWEDGKPKTIREKEIDTFSIDEFFRNKIGRKIDYLEREALNSKIGFLGESFVLEYEKNNLLKAHRNNLAERVEQVSLTRGDGLGYDVLSFQNDGKPKFIEVKTTVTQKESFFITDNELNFSRDYSGQFYLYRLTNFNWEANTGNMYVRQGNLNTMMELKPILYEGKFV
ncbi:MAG: DUF3883 domain-containing protein [Clostridiaceae bacterium]